MRVEDDAEKYLFVWAGDQARTNPDFLAVINFNAHSRNYGKVITTVPVPAPGAAGNEPHHVGLSRDGRVLACGGLLSVLRAQNEIFFFDVSNPRAPRFISSADPPHVGYHGRVLPTEQWRLSRNDDGWRWGSASGQSRRIQQRPAAGERTSADASDGWFQPPWHLRPA